MKLLDRLKTNQKKPEETEPSAAQTLPQTGEGSLETLWFSLYENPNQKDRLPELLSICDTKGGPAAAHAALETLSETAGSWLPQVYLGRMSLEQNDFPAARAWYDAILEMQEPEDYALFMISADLGRCGFAGEMPGLIAGLYDVQKHNIYIGLNLLQAYRETNNPEKGSELLEKIRAYDNPEIHDFLDSFSEAFAGMRAGPETGGTAADTPDSSGQAESPAEAVPAEKKPKRTEAVPSHRPVMVDVPVWSHGFPGMQDLLPGTAGRKRVGMYMYADTSPQDAAGTLPEDTIGPAEFAVSLPLFIGERLLFTTHFAPIALFPIDREKGPQAENAEPDVQSLFALCTKEALDFVITGTVYLDGTVYRVRSWILDRAKQSARIVAKDLPAGNFGVPFNDMVSDIMNLFFDKRYVRPSGRNDFPYAVPSPELSQTQLQAESYLLYQYLVRQDVCSASILPDSKKMLSTYASLAGTDPKNLEYLMMLLSGMHNVWKTGSDAYTYYRQLLYDVADRSRYSSCVKSVVAEINALLMDK